MNTNSEEIWKNINGYSNYEISNVGQVRNSKSGKMLKPGKLRCGYLLVCLRANAKTKNHLVQHLVAAAFIENPMNKPCIDHIDGNRQNNRTDNLRYATYSENSMNTTKRANTTSTHKGVSFYKNYSKWHATIFVDGKKKHLGYFENETDAAVAYNVSAQFYFGDYAKLNAV